MNGYEYASECVCEWALEVLNEECSDEVMKWVITVTILLHYCVTGVEDIQCDVEEKRVTVVCDDEADEQLMLTKLLKWSEASGKSVALVSA